MPRFTVIIPTFNRAELVTETVQSVLDQTFPDFEIIVVNDGSTDDTLVRLSHHFGDRIKIHSQSNQGIEIAYNQGIDLAQGEFVALLDSDDLFFPNTLERYDRLLNHHPGVNLLLGAPVHFTADENPDPPSVEVPLEYNLHPDYLSKDQGGFTGCSQMVVRTQCLRERGAFRTHNPLRWVHDDFYFLLKHGTLPGVLILRSPGSFAYRRHGGNSVNDVRRLLHSIAALLDAERQGEFPGGKLRRGQRANILAGTLLFWSWQGLRQGHGKMTAALLGRNAGILIRGIIAKLQCRLRRQPRRRLSTK